MDALERLGGETWFRLGDQDLATHLYRTGGSERGRASRRSPPSWQRPRGSPCGSCHERRPGPHPADPPAGAGDPLDPEEHEVAFQHYFVRLRHDVAVSSIAFDGAASASPAPGVLDAIGRRARHRLPVQPPRLHRALLPCRCRRSPGRPPPDVVAVSPIIAGAALKGPRTACFPSSARGVGGRVARLYAPGRDARDRRADASLAAPSRRGLRCVVARPSWTPHGRRSRGKGRARCPLSHRARSPPRSPSSGAGIGEVTPGADLAAVIAAALAPASPSGPHSPSAMWCGHPEDRLQAEGQLVAIDAEDPAAKERLVESESVRILRRRGELLITETRHGFICANAGVDLSNWPKARRRSCPSTLTARRVGCAPTRASARPRWGGGLGHVRRHARGVTDVAIGCAGVAAVLDLRERTTLRVASWWPPRSAWPTRSPAPPSS